MLKNQLNEVFPGRLKIERQQQEMPFYFVRITLGNPGLYSIRFRVNLTSKENLKGLLMIINTTKVI